jgi:hypothetical protein
VSSEAWLTGVRQTGRQRLLIPVALRQRLWIGGKGAKGGARGVLVREDERGEEKGQRRQAARF